LIFFVTNRIHVFLSYNSSNGIDVHAFFNVRLLYLLIEEFSCNVIDNESIWQTVLILFHLATTKADVQATREKIQAK
jgi:hypothetical protein